MELIIAARTERTGERNSARCKLEGPVSLGRGPESPVPLDGNGISREHFRLNAEGDGLFITDLSSNGTWVNGQRLKKNEPSALRASDVVRIPGFEISVSRNGASTAETPKSVPSPSPPAAVEPLQPAGPLDAVREFGKSLSKLDRFLIALSLATGILLVLYAMS